MAGPFFVDDSGSSTSTYDTWAKAATSINTLDAAVSFASGETVYFGVDTQCQATNTTGLNIFGPSSSPPVSFISSTIGAGSTVSYSASTTKQIDTTEGSYDVQFIGAFALYGMSVASGRDVRFTSGNDEFLFAEACRFAVGENRSISFSAGQQGSELRRCVFDLTADGTTSRSNGIFFVGNTLFNIKIIDCSFVNLQYRSGQVFALNSSQGIFEVSGTDFTGLAVGTEILPNNLSGGRFVFLNCTMPSTWTPHLASNSQTGEADFYNCGDADAPTYHYAVRQQGVFISSADIYRSAGATVQSMPVSYLATTYSNCAEGNPLHTPWIYFDVDSTGSKTFDLYITNDTADFTDAQVWLEVEYYTTSGGPETTLKDDQRATITTTPTNQTDDTASTWNGTGPSFTYKQKLSVSATVNQVGMHRARVGIGMPSIGSARYFYIDPFVTVT